VRLTVELINEPGRLHDLTGAISELGGNIVGLGQTLGESSETQTFTAKVSGVKLEELKKAVEPVVVKIVDIRETN